MKFVLPITLSLRNKIHLNTMRDCEPSTHPRTPAGELAQEKCLAGQSLSRAIYLMIIPEKLRQSFKKIVK